MIYRGSEWRQWDLHFHTPSSYDYKNKNVSNEDIVRVLSSNQIAAVAITDHHVIDIKRIKELQALGQGKITFFPGIEFLSDAKGKQPVHIIGIFSENADLDYIWGQLENRTNIKKIKGEHKEPNEIYCDLFETCNLIHELGGVVTIHAGSKSNSIDSITNSLPHYEAQKDDISKVIDIYEMGKESDCEEYKKYVFPNIEREVPMIMCSDNHNIEQYTRKQNLWIKADLTFEGLKQIIYEPNERVTLCQSKPDEKNIYNVIDSVVLSEPGFWEGTIPLNPNLNTIIGGRSTGKSSLLKAIAAKHSCSEVSPEDYIMNHLDNVTINWKDGSDQGDRDIEFFPQNYMLSIANSGEKTNKLVESIIKQKDEGNLLSDLNAKLELGKKEIREKIYTLFNKVEEVRKTISLLKEKGNKEGVIQQINLFKSKINNIQKQSTLNKQELSQYQSYLQSVQENNKQIDAANKDLVVFSKIKTQSPILSNFEYDNGLSLLEFQQNASEIVSQFRELRTETEQKWVNIVDEFINKTQAAKKEIENKNNLIISTELYKRGNDYNTGNKELSQLSEQLKEESKKLDEIESLERNKDSHIKQIKSLLSEIVKTHVAFKQKCKDIEDKLKIEFEGLSIRVAADLRYQELKEFLESKFNLRGNSRQEYVSNVLDQYDISTMGICERLIKDLISNKLELKGANNPLSVSVDFFSTNWYGLNYKLNYQGDEFVNMSEGKQAFVILMLLLEFSDKKTPILIDQPEDSLDNRAIYNELVTYIKKKKKKRQIILVTHNSNVVVSADSENVIVANQNGTNSQNANNNKFDYINGSLENTKKKDKTIHDILRSQGIREHVCDILEGGKIAFEKREQKYGFKN